MSASFPVPIYGGRVVICTTQDDYSKEYLELEEEPAGDIEDTRGLSSRHTDKKKDQCVYLVGVFDENSGTLVHELVHTCFEILSYCGIPVNKRNDEVFAYLMDTLFTESVSAMRANENTSA